MYSSGKFLVPITIVGPDFVAGRAVPAAPPRTIATPKEIANAAFAALRVCFLITSTPFSRRQHRGPYVTEGLSVSSLSVTRAGQAILPRRGPSRSRRRRGRRRGGSSPG